MEKNFKINYEKVEDILYIRKREKVKISIDLALPSGDIVIDVGFDGFVKGIEIFNASKFFALKTEELTGVKEADFSSVYTPSYVAITIVLLKEKQIIKNNLIVPYNKRLALTA